MQQCMSVEQTSGCEENATNDFFCVHFFRKFFIIRNALQNGQNSQIEIKKFRTNSEMQIQKFRTNSSYSNVIYMQLLSGNEIRRKLEDFRKCASKI